MSDQPTYDELAQRVAELEAALRDNHGLTSGEQGPEGTGLSALTDELQFRHILDHAAAVIFIKNISGQYIFVNQRFKDLHDVTDEAFGVITDDDLFLPAVADQFRENDRHVLEAGQPVEFEEKVPYEDGTHTVLSIKFPLFNNEGQPIAVGGIASDINDRKNLENALQRNEERYKMAQRMGRVGNWEYDLNTAHFWGSDEAKRLYGFAPDSADFTVEEVENRIPERDRVHQALVELIEEDTPYDLQFDIRPARGAPYRIIHSIAEVQRDENGAPLKVVGVIQDVTEKVEAEKEKRELEKQLLHAQKLEAIGTLAGGIAHDFNNFLSVILGNVSLALDQLPTGHEISDRLEAVTTAINRAQGLTRQLLTFAKGGAPILVSRNINTIIQKASVFSSAGARSSCDFALEDNLWNAEVDAHQLDQVISNLVINANQAMPDGGRIFISTTNEEVTSGIELPLDPGRYIGIGIRDEGSGIRPEDLPQIFDPYFTTKPTGSGLGLATSFSIIKRHGGLITVESQTQGGTLFKIYLPATEHAPQAESSAPEQEHRSSGRILVLDDQQDILDMLERMLQMMGYTTIQTTRGSEAIEIFRREKQANRDFDAVFLDLTIPGDKGGAEVMQELLRIDPRVVGVVSSGYSNDTAMARFKDFGFAAVLPKPFTRSDLARILERIEPGPEN